MLFYTLNNVEKISSGYIKIGLLISLFGGLRGMAGEKPQPRQCPPCGSLVTT